MDSPLKQGPKRTILLEGTSSPRRVVKRFHSPGAVDGLKDGLRAWREYRALCLLRRRGLPVPRALGVRRRSGSWELVQEELAQCVPLAQLLSGAKPWPAARQRVARALGQLLADLWSARIWHPDLHMGNVLVGPGGEVHLIDLARVRTRWTRNVHEFLLPLAAGAREWADEVFRARVLRSFTRACEASEILLGSETFEQQARERRREDVGKRLVRFQRVSGAMAPLHDGNVRGLAHRDLTADHAVLTALDPSAEFCEATWDPTREVQVVEGPLKGHLLQRWNTAARLESHGIPTERPLAWIHTEEPRVVFDRPRGCLPFGECWTTWSPSERSFAAAAAGTLMGALQDRGLGVDGRRPLALLASSPTGLLLEYPRLIESSEPQATGTLQQWTESTPGVTPTEAWAWVQGFAAAQRSTRAERMRIRAQLDAQIAPRG
ncbi:MAG: lipopolysaccharide kinase InaA family protein [Planctomycetota bacterium]|nr:lipopolysaccharide kinase InaA family protein [Planctomycetota bacterium]